MKCRARYETLTDLTPVRIPFAQHRARPRLSSSKLLAILNFTSHARRQNCHWKSSAEWILTFEQTLRFCNKLFRPVGCVLDSKAEETEHESVLFSTSLVERHGIKKKEKEARIYAGFENKADFYGSPASLSIPSPSQATKDWCPPESLQIVEKNLKPTKLMKFLVLQWRVEKCETKMKQTDHIEQS